MSKQCFVIMPIGDQKGDGYSLTSSELKSKYNDLIREAIHRADPTFIVKRSDEISAPGMISTDILTRIMHAELVIADISYPNPNVFYELGLRHACKQGTIIIRDKSAPKAPFDLSHLRHIEYENTPSGLKALGDQLRSSLTYLQDYPDHPDSQFQEIAKLIKYKMPDFSPKEEEPAPEAVVMMAMMQSPEVLDMVMKQARGEEVDKEEMLRVMANNPSVAKLLLHNMAKSGQLDFFGKSPSTVSKKKLPKYRSKRKN